MGERGPTINNTEHLGSELPTDSEEYKKQIIKMS